MIKKKKYKRTKPISKPISKSFQKFIDSLTPEKLKEIVNRIEKSIKEESHGK